MSQLSSYENYKQNTTSEEQASFVSTGKVPVSGKLSENDDYTTKSVALDDLLHAGDNTIESISVAGTTITPVDKSVDIPAATTSSAGVLSATDKTKLDSMTAGYPSIAGYHHRNNNGVTVTPDSSGKVFLPGDGGNPWPTTPYLINGCTYKVSAEILFTPTGCYRADEPTAGIYQPMTCEFKFLWGDTIDLTRIDNYGRPSQTGDGVFMNTTFNVGQPGGFQGYWMHRVVTCYSSDPDITSLVLNIGISCSDASNIGIDFTQVGTFRWSHMIIEPLEQSMFVGR